MKERVLELVELRKRFGGLNAISGVSLDAYDREIVGLIGPNGAGKTTVFNLISGVVPVDSGVVKFNGENITNMKPHTICRKGIGRTFQIVRSFPSLSCVSNVRLGVWFGKNRKPDVDSIKEAEKWMEFVGILSKKDVPAKNLNLNERKKLELARVLAASPKVVLLDEITAGLNSTETTEAMELIRRTRDEHGVTIMWIEHVMRAVLGVSDRIVVLDQGQKIAEGAPSEIPKNAEVIKAYLGREASNIA